MTEVSVPKNPLSFLRTIFRTSRAVILAGRGLQEPTRKALVRDLQQVSANCRSSYERFLKQLAPLKTSYSQPATLVKEVQRLASQPEYRQTFKPDKLCGDVADLLTRLHSNLDPLKYSIGVTRIGKLREQLAKFQNYDLAFYQTFDNFAIEVSRLATKLEAAMTAGKDPSHIQNQIRRKVEKVEADVSATLREVLATQAQIQI